MKWTIGLVVTALLAAPGAAAGDPVDELLEKVDEAGENPPAFVEESAHNLSGTKVWAHEWACAAGYYYLGHVGDHAWGIVPLCHRESAHHEPANDTDSNDTDGYRPPVSRAANDTADAIEETYHAVDNASSDHENATDHGFDLLRAALDAGNGALDSVLDAGAGLADVILEAGAVLVATVEQAGDEAAYAIGHFSAALAGAVDWSSEVVAGTVEASSEEVHDSYDVMAAEAAHLAAHVSEKVGDAVDAIERAVEDLLGSEGSSGEEPEPEAGVDVSVSVRGRGLLSDVTSKLSLP